MWIWQAFTGLLLLVLLALHMIFNHFVVEGGLRTYRDVVAYLSHPLVFAWEIALLIMVTAHALMGVRAILLDLGIRPATDRWLKRGLTLLALGIIGYGMWLSWLIRSRGL
jgi:succinate dehydrogenase hydrophobic anchor subunit